MSIKKTALVLLFTRKPSVGFFNGFRSIDLDHDFAAVLLSCRTHNHADGLGDASLLADDSAHIGGSHVQMIHDGSVLSRFVDSDLHRVLVLDQSASESRQ